MLIAVTAALRNLPHLHGTAQYQFPCRFDPLFRQQIHEA